MLDRIFSIYPEKEIDLVSDHSPFVVGPISIPGSNRVPQFLQRPSHSSGEVEVDAADSCPTVYQGSGLSDFSVFRLVKSHRDSD